MQGRKIVVFPDLSKDGNTFDLWNDRAIEFQKQMKNTTFKTFDLLERMGTTEQKNEGLDIADILINTIGESTENHPNQSKQMN